MMRTGDFNPHFFDYGGLTFYLYLAVDCGRFLWGAMGREWAALDQVWEGNFLVSSRVLSVALGTWTVFLVYRSALRWGTAIALIAVVAMASQPQSVREAHYALTDTPLTFFVALTLLLSLRAAEQQRSLPFFYAGLAAGAAAAVKYNGALALMMPVLAAVGLMTAHASAVAIGVALCGAALAFLCGAPYSVLDLPAFLNGFASLMQHYNRPQSVLETLITYFKHIRGWFAWAPMLGVEIGWGGVAICAIGLVALALRIRERASRAATLVLLVFPVTFLWFISKQGSLQYARYALPITPMLVICLGAGIVAIRQRLLAQSTRPRRIAAAAIYLVLFPPLASSVHRDITQYRLSTTEAVGYWLISHTSSSDSVVMEGDVLRLPPRISIERVPRLIDRPIEAYRQANVTYLVMSSAEQERNARNPQLRAADTAKYLDLMANGQTVQVFHADRNLPGPTLTILKLTR